MAGKNTAVLIDTKARLAATDLVRIDAELTIENLVFLSVGLITKVSGLLRNVLR